MALKYGDSQVLKIIYKEKQGDVETLSVEPKRMKCSMIGGSPSGKYDFIKGYTCSVSTNQWSWISKVTWTRTECAEASVTTNTGELTENNPSFITYYGDKLKIEIETNSGYHFTEASDNSQNSNTKYTIDNITMNDEAQKEYIIPTIYKNKNYVQVAGTDYDATNHKGHIRGVYLSTDANAKIDTESKSANGYYDYGDTVYAFYILLDEGASETPGTLVSTETYGKIYRKDSWTVTENDSKDFGNISLGTITYANSFLDDNYNGATWNNTSSFVSYWGDLWKSDEGYSYNREPITLTFKPGGYANYSEFTRTLSKPNFNNPQRYYIKNTTSGGVQLDFTTHNYDKNWYFVEDQNWYYKYNIIINCSVPDRDKYILFGRRHNWTTYIDLTQSETEIDVEYPNESPALVALGINSSDYTLSNGTEIDTLTKIDVKLTRKYAWTTGNGSNNYPYSNQSETKYPTITASYIESKMINNKKFILFGWQVDYTHEQDSQELRISYSDMQLNLKKRDLNSAFYINYGLDYDENESSYEYFYVENKGSVPFEFNIYLDSTIGHVGTWANITLNPGQVWNCPQPTMHGYFQIVCKYNNTTYYRPYVEGNQVYYGKFGTGGAGILSGYLEEF